MPLHRVNVLLLAIRFEPGQLTGVFPDYLFGDALIPFVLEKDVNAGWRSVVLARSPRGLAR